MILNRARAVIRGQRSKIMKKTKRVKKAISAVYFLDEVLKWYEYRDFVEIIGRTGGDTLTFRVYDNGTITER